MKESYGDASSLDLTRQSDSMYGVRDGGSVVWTRKATEFRPLKGKLGMGYGEMTITLKGNTRRFPFIYGPQAHHSPSTQPGSQWRATRKYVYWPADSQFRWREWGPTTRPYATSISYATSELGKKSHHIALAGRLGWESFTMTRRYI